MNHLLAFQIDNVQFGLHVPLVDRVVPACEIIPVPDGPASILGLINVQGVITPVLNTRKKLGLPERTIDVTDYFVITSGGRHHIALPVDSIKGLLEYSDEQLVHLDAMLSQQAPVSVVCIVDGLVLLYDPARALSETEQIQLAVALERTQRQHEQGH